jgi:hypothetical protein
MMWKSLRLRINLHVLRIILSFNRIPPILFTEFLFEYGLEQMTRERIRSLNYGSALNLDSPLSALSLRNIGFLIRVYPPDVTHLSLCFLSRYPLFNLLSDYLKAMWIVSRSLLKLIIALE